MKSIARVLYEHRGELDDVDGALEIVLDSGVVVFDADADGESLRLRWHEWTDPFADSLSAELEAYVREHGRWRRVDFSNNVPYCEFIGQRVTSACLLRNEWRRVGGVRISVESRSMWFVVEGDEGHVYWSLPSDFTEVDS